jgi:hypothetical protein
MDQKCFESNGLPKDEDSKLKKKEEKEKRMQAVEIYPLHSRHLVLTKQINQPP